MRMIYVLSNINWKTRNFGTEREKKHLSDNCSPLICALLMLHIRSQQINFLHKTQFCLSFGQKLRLLGRRIVLESLPNR